MSDVVQDTPISEIRLKQSPRLIALLLSRIFLTNDAIKPSLFILRLALEFAEIVFGSSQRSEYPLTEKKFNRGTRTRCRQRCGFSFPSNEHSHTRRKKL